MTKRTNVMDRSDDRGDTAGGESRADAGYRPIEWLDGLPLAGAVDAPMMDIVELAHDIATIASATSDPVTGPRLMEVVERILRVAGLPSASA